MPISTRKRAYTMPMPAGRRVARRTTVTRTVRRPTFLSKFRTKTPGRFVSSKPQYRKTKALTNTLRNISETYTVPMSEYDQSAPSAVLGTSDVYMYGLTTGIGVVPAHLPRYHSLGGFTFPSTVQGNNVYVRKGQVMIQIDMSPAQATLSLCEFRVIMFKNKRQASPVSTTATPGTQLFLDTNTGYWGYDSTDTPPAGQVGVTGPKLMTALTNKQKFIIYRDQRFTLSPPHVQDSDLTTYNQQSSSKYPSMKRLKFDMPVYKKVTLDSNNHCVDLDYSFNVLILSRPLAGENLGNDFTVSTMRGLVTYTDF